VRTKAQDLGEVGKIDVVRNARIFCGIEIPPHLHGERHIRLKHAVSK
jgi:hypothetical protein